uniref:TRASH domain-containing protein n=1 Tax=Kryptolebias marmoratus TaxID=37003 RepID=A0A3Q3BGJ4_KRYMA
IKEEPTEEEFAPDRSESVSSVDVKGEPKVGRFTTQFYLFMTQTEELKIDSVFSLTEDSKPASPSLAHMDLPASCSTCQKVLEDGETVYQRKAHTDLFCSTSCLPLNGSCSVREMKNSQDIVQAEADTTGTKDFCSQTCLSSFKYKRIVSTKLPLVPAASHSQCSVCSRYCISKHEVILQDVVQMICSDPCFHRFCTINNLFMCEDCGARCNTPLRLKTEDGDTPLCSADCLSRFKQKMESAQPCTMCRSSKLTADMVENRNQEDVVELFCSNSCVMASKIQAICASGTQVFSLLLEAAASSVQKS